MKTFRYCLNHKADEVYMAKMCHKGWAAKRLVEGVWSFEPCRPDQYTYRVCYLRGMSRTEVEALKRRLAAEGITFVSRYSFWAIFRSERAFQLYTPEEERDVCVRILRPMRFGSVLSWIVFLAFLWLTGAVSAWFGVPAALLALYGAMCTCLACSYTALLRSLRA